MALYMVETAKRRKGKREYTLVSAADGHIACEYAGVPRGNARRVKFDHKHGVINPADLFDEPAGAEPEPETDDEIDITRLGDPPGRRLKDRKTGAERFVTDADQD